MGNVIREKIEFGKIKNNDIFFMNDGRFMKINDRYARKIRTNEDLYLNNENINDDQEFSENDKIIVLKTFDKVDVFIYAA